MGEMKNLKAKVKFKHELEKDWLLSSYVPGESELVVYDVETGNDLPEGRDTPYKYPRFKVGDGTTNINDLPFAAQADLTGYATEEYVENSVKTYTDSKTEGYVIEKEQIDEEGNTMTNLTISADGHINVDAGMQFTVSAGESIYLDAAGVYIGDKEIATQEYVDEKLNDIDITQEQADWNETDENASNYIKNKPGLSAGPGKHHLIAAENYTAGTVIYTSEIIEGSRLESDGWGWLVLPLAGMLYPYYYAQIDIYDSKGTLYKDAYLNTVNGDLCDERGNGISFWWDNEGHNLDLSNEQFYFTITDGSTPPDWLTEEISFSINQTDGGDYGLAIGENIKNGGNHNLLVGHDLQHEGDNAFIVGHYNKTNNEALLQVGSGTEYYPKNALEVTATETRAPRIRVENITPKNENELATKYYVDSAIENIQLPDVDLTGYATEEYVDSKTKGYEYSPFVEDGDYSTHEGAKISTPNAEIAISERYDGNWAFTYVADLVANNVRMSLVDRVVDENGPLAGQDLESEFSVEGVDKATINGKEIATEEYVNEKTAGYSSQLTKLDPDMNEFWHDDTISLHTESSSIDVNSYYDGVYDRYSISLNAGGNKLELGNTSEPDGEGGLLSTSYATINGKEIATEEYVDNAIENVPEQVQADWKQTDETAPDYIKNKLGLELGEAPKTTQQPGSLAISEGATALGENNFAGLKSFEIVGWDLSNSTYTLSSALPEEIPVGAEFGIQVRLIYYRHGTITTISDDRLTVTVDNYVDIDAEIANKGPNIVKRFWLTDYPTAGDTDEGLYTFAAGSENLAGHFAATALGYGNKAIGKYSTALGRQTEAHYAAFSAGYDTKALGEEAIALGYSSTADAHRAVVIGQGLNSTINNQIVVGKFNSPADDAIFVIGNGTTKSATSNAFTVGFDGQVDIIHEPTKDTSAINKKYVDAIEASIDTRVDGFDDKLDTFQDRLANIEAGFITIDTDDGVIELPKMPGDEIIISKIGGNSVEGINKIAPENIITGGGTNGLGAQYTISGNDIIVTYANTTAGMFAIGIDIDVKPNTVYRLAFNRVASGTPIGVIYCYTDKLWGTSVNIYSPSKGTTKNTINFTGDYLTFDSGSNDHLVLGLYSNKNRTSLTDVISNLILTEGEDEVDYVPYQISPCKTTSIKTYAVDNSLIATYTVPSNIQNLPGYGHTYSVVDFLNQTYSYRTTDGKNYSSIPTIISIADIITEAPRLTAASEGKVEFVNSQNAGIDASILYKKDADAIDIATISLDELDDICTTGGLFRNGVSEMSWYDLLANEYITVNSGELKARTALNNLEPFELIVDNNVTTIGSYAFDVCNSLTSITIPDSVTSIGISAFRGCDSLTSIVIPDSVTSIETYAFRDCDNLTSVVIGNSVTSIGNYAFDKCNSLTSITIPDSVTSIGTNAFYDCISLTSVVIGDSVTSISYRTFMNCKNLTSVVIPDSVTIIGDDAFYWCNSLTSITIPDSVTFIGSKAFGGCNNLTDIYVPWAEGAVSSAPWGATNATIHYNSEV